MSKLNIEGKVPIAADAAELIIAYLDELSIKLVQAGVKNSYLIVADVESMIIEALKKQGKTTKLGNEEVLKILNDEFDDPDEFIKIYLADMNPEILAEKVDRFLLDPNQRRLVRRPKPASQTAQETDKSYFMTILSLIAYLAPLIIIFIAIVLNVTSSFENRFAYMIESVALTILAAFYFIIFELIIGLNGSLIVNVKHSIAHRNFFRGLYISNLILTYFQYGSLEHRWYQYYNGNQVEYFLNLPELIRDFTSILIAYIMILGILEFLIFIRDHLPNFFPLEPEFRPIIRLITPPYLLVVIGLFLMIVLNYSYGLLMTGSFLALIGILWAAFRGYKVSSRFYTISASTIFYAGLIVNDDVIFQLFPYAIAGIIALLIFKIFYKPRAKKSTFKKLKKMYSEYYDERGANE